MCSCVVQPYELEMGFINSTHALACKQGRYGDVCCHLLNLTDHCKIHYPLFSSSNHTGPLYTVVILSRIGIIYLGSQITKLDVGNWPSKIGSNARSQKNIVAKKYYSSNNFVTTDFKLRSEHSQQS